MKLLIPNATGLTNIGDQAILNPLISLIQNVFPNAEFVIHSFEYKKYKESPYKIKSTIYSWAVFENNSFLQRIYRSFLVVFSLLLRIIHITYSPDKHLRSLLEDYKQADLIVFVGGGYLRSQKGISQSLNLLFLSCHFLFAKSFHKKIIIAPISFGPFAYSWQEWYFSWILNGIDVISAREEHSFSLLKKVKLKNVILSSDTALFAEYKKSKKVRSELVLGFTVRNWLWGKDQDTFERSIAKSLHFFSQKNGVVIQPIVQVDNNKYGDKDFDITQQIVTRIGKLGTVCKPIYKINDLKKSVAIYGEIDLLLGMRMHSNILAALHATPFVAISYEYKTEGIAKELGVEEFCIKVEDVTEKKLLELLENAFTNRKKISHTIESSLQQIKQRELKKWNTIFSQYKMK